MNWDRKGREARPAQTDASAPPILEVEDLAKHFHMGSRLLGRATGRVKAVDGCSFTLSAGETLGIVGESGCGKSTIARMLIHLIEPDRGRIIVDGVAASGSSGLSIRNVRRRMQMVFQDSNASLNPRHSAAEEVAFGLTAQGVRKAEALARAHRSLQLVGLEPTLYAHRYPHELSGGQRQRVNIARALAMEPRILILDEAVSALDKSIQAQVLNLLVDLKHRLGLSYVFISHDLNVVRFISDRVLVMYLGKVMEIGPVDRLYAKPAHPYTKALIASRLSVDPRRRILAVPVTGDPPSPSNPPPGCRFSTRCPIAEPCRGHHPAMSGSSHDDGCQIRFLTAAAPRRQ
jgi:peptide/nickel transport system ATP-binding protein